MEIRVQKTVDNTEVCHFLLFVTQGKEPCNMRVDSIKPMERRKHMKTKSVRHKPLTVYVFSIFSLLFVGFLTLTVCSAKSPPPPPDAKSSAAFEKGVPGGVIVNTMDVSARVTAIDTANRKLTLLGPDGDKFTVKLGPEAVNFDQIRVGDLVKATVTEQTVVFLDKEGTSGPDGAAGVVALAPKGAQPGGIMAETVQVTAKVTAIDQTNRTATLQFKDGSSKIFPVRDDIDLSQRKVGEMVVFQVTEMIAISVEKP